MAKAKVVMLAGIQAAKVIEDSVKKESLMCRFDDESFMFYQEMS